MKKLIKQILKEERRNQTIDYILDKISSFGMKSLSKKEKEFLNQYSKDLDFTNTEMDIKQKQDEKQYRLEYDPRKDTEFFEPLNMDFSGWSDELIEKSRIDLFWQELTDEELEHFFEYYNININDYLSPKGYLPGEIPKDLIKKFKFYIENIY